MVNSEVVEVSDEVDWGVVEREEELEGMKIMKIMREFI